MEVLENNKTYYPDSELVLDNKNAVYHLGVAPEDVTSTILLVGDQDRVAMISKHFDTIRHQSQHREFVIHTGSYNQKEISVISTGIGTDNIDIVVNELDALFNIDLQNRQDKATHTPLTIIRIGTCGILQSNIPVHSFILSEAALGLDNVAHFYDIEFTETELRLKQEFDNHLGLPLAIKPYYKEASKKLLNQFSSEQTNLGITVTSSGFYGPQGRTLRIPTHTSHLNEKLASFKASNGLSVVNFEMESSALFALGNALGHDCLTICLGIANRSRKEFSENYVPHMERLIHYVLNRL